MARTAAALIVLGHAAATLAAAAADTFTAPSEAADVAPVDAPADAPEETDRPTVREETNSPTYMGQTTSPPTSMPTSTTNPAEVSRQIESLLNVPIVFMFGGVSMSVTMTTVSYVEAAGAVVYTTTLTETLAEAQVTDVAEGGFVHTLSIALAAQAGIVPASRIPYKTMVFTGLAQGHRSRTLGSGLTFSVCNAVQGGACITYSPTGSPTVMSSFTKNAGDDDFPAWAIALCVVLPVVAVAAGGAVFVACKSGGEAEEVSPQSDKSESDKNDNEPEEVPPQSDKPNDNEPASCELRDSQV